VLIALIGVALFSACTSPSKKVDDAQDEVTEAQEDLIKAKDDYNLSRIINIIGIDKLIKELTLSCSIIAIKHLEFSLKLVLGITNISNLLSTRVSKSPTILRFLLFLPEI
jgi:hypothetical protein